MDFSLDEFCASFPSVVQSALKEEGFDTLPALLCASVDDIDSFEIKRGHKAILKDAIYRLQSKHGTGPLRQPRGETETGKTEASLSQLLDSMTVQPDLPSGKLFRVVDFVSSSLFPDEEVTLGDGVSLKLNSKIKLEKISPAMWITANSRIMSRLLNEDPRFSAQNYLRYTEMIGELAARYTWQSVLLFDDEYRQRQAKIGFDWGTDAPHLGTVMLRDRERSSAFPAGRKITGSSFRRFPGKEICRQFNRGACSYGTSCLYDHSCAVCGHRDHGSKDHQTDHPPTARPSMPALSSIRSNTSA